MLINFEKLFFEWKPLNFDKIKSTYFGGYFIFFLIFSSFISLVLADFQLGGSRLPINEVGFIEYDFDQYTAPGPLRIRVGFVDLYKMYEPIEVLGVNITVNELNSLIFHRYLILS